MFDAVQAFVHDPQRSSGYFVLTGEPGIGKSSIAAELVRRFGWVHHFNRRTAGIVTCAGAWHNLAGQLRAKHAPALRRHDGRATVDGAFVTDLLTGVSRALAGGAREVIVIDALDEADRTGLPAGANALLLPPILPPGLFLIVALRPALLDRRSVHTPDLQIEHGRYDFALHEDDRGNQEDLRRYIDAKVASAPVASALAARGIDAARFAAEVSTRSEGNFLYVRYVFADVEVGRPVGADELPVGLNGYYAQHWKLIRSRDPVAWDASDLPVIYGLARTPGAVTLGKLARMSRSTKLTVSRVVDDIGQFVHRDEIVDDDGKRQITYRLYHDSFRTFVDDKVSAYGNAAEIRAEHRRRLEDDVRRAFGKPKRKRGSR